MIQLFICSHVSHEMMSIITLTSLIIWLFAFSQLIISLILIRHTPLHCNALKCSTVFSLLLIPWKFLKHLTYYFALLYKLSKTFTYLIYVEVFQIYICIPNLWQYVNKLSWHISMEFQKTLALILYLYLITSSIFQTYDS